MEIDVLLFASYADAFGESRVRVHVQDDATAGDVLAAVRALAAERAPVAGLPPAAIAVNREYVQAAARVAGGDEVAVIPPVAGG